MTTDQMPWLTWLRDHNHTPTRTGSVPTALIEEAFEKHTNYGKLHGTTPSSCAAILSMALEVNGYLSAHSAAAVDFTRIGLGCALKQGAICVFKWKNGEHHVTVCEKPVGEDEVICRGANQHGEIDLSAYPRKYLIAVRWPLPMKQTGAVA